MEGLQKAFRTIYEDPPSISKLKSSTFSSPFEKPSGAGGGGFNSSSSSSADQSQLLLIRPPGRVVSLGTCSKVCAICFIAGVVVGFTLKRRVRRWASKLLKRLKDD